MIEEKIPNPNGELIETEISMGTVHPAALEPYRVRFFVVVVRGRGVRHLNGDGNLDGLRFRAEGMMQDTALHPGIRHGELVFKMRRVGWCDIDLNDFRDFHAGRIVDYSFVDFDGGGITGYGHDPLDNLRGTAGEQGRQRNENGQDAPRRPYSLSHTISIVISSPFSHAGTSLFISS